MNHHVVVEIKRKRPYNQAGAYIIEQCWNILYNVPIEREDLGEEALSFKGCLAWIENNKVEGSKYAVVKMYLV